MGVEESSDVLLELRANFLFLLLRVVCFTIRLLRHAEWIAFIIIRALFVFFVVL